MIIEGKVVSGTQEGSFFMSLEVYKAQFREKLGFKPYPGTLNINVSAEDATSLTNYTEKMEIIRGSGKYGDVRFIPARINQELDGALLFPVKTHHPHQVLEFVSAKNLREHFKLEDGSKVRLEINLI